MLIVYIFYSVSENSAKFVRMPFWDTKPHPLHCPHNIPPPMIDMKITHVFFSLQLLVMVY